MTVIKGEERNIYNTSWYISLIKETKEHKTHYLLTSLGIFLAILWTIMSPLSPKAWHLAGLTPNLLPVFCLLCFALAPWQMMPPLPTYYFHFSCQSCLSYSMKHFSNSLMQQREWTISYTLICLQRREFSRRVSVHLSLTNTTFSVKVYMDGPGWPHPLVPVCLMLFLLYLPSQ